MKRLLLIIMTLAFISAITKFNVSAAELESRIYSNDCIDYEITELSKKEKEFADNCINELNYDDSRSMLFYSSSTDYLFSYDFTNDYFYKQLNSDEKELYKNMYKAAEKIQNSDVDFEASESQYNSAFCEKIIYSSSISSSRLMEIYRAFRFSNPQFFFFGTCAFYGGYSKGSNYLYLRVGEMFLKSADRKAMINTISTKTSQWLAEINKCPNSLEKELKIIEILCENICYGYGFDVSNINEKAEYHQTIAGAIGKGVCVCNGYAMAFSYLCHLVDIDCIGVVGQGHAWNRVNLFGDWYEVDVTWIDSDYGYLWNIWKNKSTEVFLAQDASRNTNAHTPRADLYTTLMLPKCLKNDPVVPDFIMGDINGDSKVNNRDLTALRRYLAGLEITITSAADLNSDGKVNNRDLTKLRRILAGLE